MKNAWLLKLKKLFSQKQLSTDSPILAANSGDAWLASHAPEAVVFAQSTADVQRLLQFAQQHRIPVTTRGAGKGYVGGCVPVHGGIVLNTMRMNRIKEIAKEDLVAVVQPGVITHKLQQAARNRGLFYPPDPASLKDSSIGGNIATNAGGPRCFKYGVTRHYVLGLEIVLMGGEILRVGSRTVKNKTGFDIMGLFVGSEGMLGVVTEATLRLLPHPPNQAVLVATFDKMQQAIDAVNRVQHAGFIPSALEISDGITLDCARKFFKNTPRGNAWVLVEVDGQHGTVKEEIRILGKLFKSLKPVTLLTSQGAQSEKLWDIRRSMSTSLKALGLKKLNEDITVPRSRFMELFKLTERLQKKSGFAIASFGHAGDGNIHVNIMVPPREKDVDPLLDALFKQVLKWNGCITGEHGIGLAKKPWWPQAVSPLSHRIHRQIKKNLDPHNLLNPGKFLG